MMGFGRLGGSGGCLGLVGTLWYSLNSLEIDNFENSDKMNLCWNLTDSSGDS